MNLNLTSALPSCKDKHTVIEDVKLKYSPDLLSLSFYFLLPFYILFFSQLIENEPFAMYLV